MIASASYPIIVTVIFLVFSDALSSLYNIVRALLSLYTLIFFAIWYLIIFWYTMWIATIFSPHMYPTRPRYPNNQATITIVPVHFNVIMYKFTDPILYKVIISQFELLFLMTSMGSWFLKMFLIDGSYWEFSDLVLSFFKAYEMLINEYNI